VRDELQEGDAQAAEDVSAVSKVWVALLERDEVLRKAREDAAAVLVAAVEFEREVAFAQVQLQQDRATLEGARSWQSQAEEKAKEADPFTWASRRRLVWWPPTTRSTWKPSLRATLSQSASTTRWR
jgi:hypothetical protein